MFSIVTALRDTAQLGLMPSLGPLLKTLSVRGGSDGSEGLCPWFADALRPAGGLS